MKMLLCVCLVFAGFALRAQTYPVSSTSSTNPAPAAQTNSAMEIRPTEIQCTGPFWCSTKSNVYVYRENVTVDNPQMKLKCELLTVEAPKWTNGTFNRVTAETNVVIDWVDTKGTNHATSEKAVYTYIVTNLATGLSGFRFETNSTVILSDGNPTVIDPSSNVFEGDPIIYDRMTGDIRSPHMGQTIITTKTNSPGLFDTPGARPAKTNVLVK